MILSSRGLKNIVCDDSVFAFKVNGQEFEISKFKAQFVSPAVARCLCLDPTQSSFEIGVPDGIEYFESIISLCEGNAISVDQSHVYGFAAVCRALGNDELIELAIGSDPVSITNVSARLSFLIADSDVGFACRHFVSLDHTSLPVNIFKLLLADNRLEIESEDWLLKVVVDRISTDNSLIGLLDYIECKYLSVEGISTFVSMLSKESISSSVWSSLCRRLEIPVSVPNVNPRARDHSFTLDRNRPFDGVFAHLSRQCGENPHNAGLVAISANDRCSSFVCHDLVSEGKQWRSESADVDHYVKIDLKDLRLTPSAYSVKTHGSLWTGRLFVRSWRFEGSNDDSRWEVLDSHANSDELMGDDRENSFAISTTTRFRFLRFIQAGVNSSNSRFFCLQRLEAFGLLQSIRQ
jgi:hypothetical protein